MFEGSNLERLTIKGMDKAMLGLALGVNAVRWTVYQLIAETPPTPANIQYYESEDV